eukprot:CAMPEP_0113943038 /NCGR_PEP_ID=MMETSP1339-20121228/17019_1 /TAXON_ID=94617 /ORGANISM="Fibrocapsa japonica" /LENGTH=228 /DNA_ID=CAMNT_0000947773 /DNA_START=60 /DNA_END=746 /DNA_ORIENTATION=- /assembly_acc=CAM_ASM_000762
MAQWLHALMLKFILLLLVLIKVFSAQNENSCTGDEGEVGIFRFSFYAYVAATLLFSIVAFMFHFWISRFYDRLIDVCARAREGSTAYVLNFLHSGGNPDKVDEEGWTALQRAARAGHLAVVRVLVQGGADLNLRNPAGWTALMYAAANGSQSIVSFLLKHGAKVDNELHGTTPLHEAVVRGHKGVVHIILNSGASIHCRNEYGDTPLDVAIKIGEIEITTLLQEYARQ